MLRGNDVVQDLDQGGTSGAQVATVLQTTMAHRDWFLPVLSLTEAAYQQVKRAIYPVPGTVVQSSSVRTGEHSTRRDVWVSFGRPVASRGG
jgi:hypothetical protein